LRGLFFQVQPSTLILNIKQYGERMAVINRLVRKESEAETGESGKSRYAMQIYASF